MKKGSSLATLSFLLGFIAFLLFVLFSLHILPEPECGSRLMLFLFLAPLFAIIFGGLSFVFIKKEELRIKKIAYLGISFALLEIFFWWLFSQSYFIGLF